MMRFSEAIRLGAALKPQGFGELFQTRYRLQFSRRWPFIQWIREDTTCALGAAYEASGGRTCMTLRPKGSVAQGFRGRVKVLRADTQFSMWDAPAEWLPLFYRETVCPVCGRKDILMRTVSHLNDGHRWSREQIADWVEFQEISGLAEGSVVGISSEAG
jgi:hypothetical protein